MECDDLSQRVSLELSQRVSLELKSERTAWSSRRQSGSKAAASRRFFSRPSPADLATPTAPCTPEHTNHAVRSLRRRKTQRQAAEKNTRTQRESVSFFWVLAYVGMTVF